MVVPAPPPIVSFAQLPALWRAYSVANGGYALSWNHRPHDGGWAQSMPKGGIAVTVFFPNDRACYPSLKLKMPTRPTTTLEGAPDTPEYRLHGRVKGRLVEVWVDIRQPHPTQAQLRFAQRVVAAIRFK